MAAKRLWLLRVPEIRRDVAALDVPVVDRNVFEHLFHVRRRRAIELMHVFGGYQTGLALLIDRTELVRQLEALEAGAEFAIEHGRKQRLLDSLERVRKRRSAAAVRIPLADNATEERLIAHLPAGILLQRDCLRVDFHGAEDLLAKLYELSQAMGNDFDAFKAVVEQPAQP